MLRLKIDGAWEPEDFIAVLEAVESLYYKIALARRLRYEDPFYWYERSFRFDSFDEQVTSTNRFLLQRARSVARADYRLTVGRISYASPGDIDLVGIGKACKSVEGIVDRLIKLFTERKLRQEAGKQAEIETARQQESLRSLKIENALTILQARLDFPDVPEDFWIALVSNDQDKLIPRIAEGKIVGVRAYDGHSPQDGAPS